MAHWCAWQEGLRSHEEILAALFIEAPFVHPTVCFRRKVVQDLGGYRQGAFPEDYDLWFRMAAAGCRFERTPETLLDWRQHPHQTSRVDPRCDRQAFDRLRAAYLPARVPQDRPIAIWGAGPRSRARARLAGLSIDMWVDVSPRLIGKVFDGAPVLAWESLDQAQPRPFVLVYVNNRGARPEISAWLEGHEYAPRRDYLHVG